MIDKLKVFTNHRGLRRYLENTTWLMAERLLRVVIGLFVGIWVARYLGPAQFGLYNYAQSFVFLFSVISTLGLDGVVVRELVNDDTKRNILLGTAFGLKLIGAILIFPILAGIFIFIEHDLYTKLIIFIIAGSLIFQSFNVIDYYYQSKVQSKYVAIANSISLGVSSLTKVVLILNNAPLISFVWVIVFDTAVLCLGLLVSYRYVSELNPREWYFDRVMAKSLIKSSLPLAFSGLVASIYMKIDQVMIKNIMGDEAVGVYAAAVRLSEAFYFIPMIIANSLFPAVLNAKKVSLDLYYTRLQRLYTFIVWSAVIISAFMTYTSDWLITILFGEEYMAATDVLKIHIWASVFVYLGVVSGSWYLSENLQSLAFLRTFYGMLINIILNFSLVPVYGIGGAAFATLISYAVAGFFFDFFTKKTRVTFYMKLKAFFFKVNL
ncbi:MULTISPECIES: flippase [unclassified Methylophaga]|uniref:flippase n=1 Tax=unclassified Methylophaga TaxID=2629249 RepID=UPI0032E3E370